MKKPLDQYGSWPTEGESFDATTRIFENAMINRFLHGEQRTVLVAPKGMGKTVLLKKKRHLLENAESGRLILPYDVEADYIVLPQTFGKGIAEQLHSTGFWKSIWELALGTAILLNLRPEDNTREFFEVHARYFPHELQREIELWLTSDQPRHTVKPSRVATWFLNAPIGVYSDFQRHVANELSQVCLTIRFGVYVFIDSFDQALRELSNGDGLDRDLWCNGQMGLVKAAWDMNRRNSHIKIYSSARREAWEAFDDENKQSIRSRVELLSYDDTDLRGMADVLFSAYEDSGSFSQYLGFDTVENKQRKEDVYAYMLRHSLGRPRGISVIGDNLHGKISRDLKTSDRVSVFRRAVNEAAPKDLIDNYLRGEMKGFLQHLNSEERISFLWRNIPTNLLNFGDLERIRARFAKEFNMDPEHCHPFCELLNLGLLGHIKEDTYSNGALQHFREPHDFSWSDGRLLPGKVTYILHPALTEIVRQHNARFASNEEIIVGRNMPWTLECQKAANRHWIKVFISYASRDGKVMKRVRDALAEYFDGHGIACEFWLDRWNLVAGTGFQQGLEQGIKASDLVLLFYTKNAANSGWVEREWRQAERHAVSGGRDIVIPVTDSAATKESDDSFLTLKHFHVIQKDREGGPGAFKKSMAKLAEDIREQAQDRKAVAS